MSREVVDVQLRDKVIFIGKVTRCPDQSRCSGLGAGLKAKLDLPLHPILVSYFEFGIRAVQILLNECHPAARFVFLSAGSVEEISKADIGRIPPHYLDFRARDGRRCYHMRFSEFLQAPAGWKAQQKRD